MADGQAAGVVPPRVSIITLGVADLGAATAFYESLGWTRSPASVELMTLFTMQGSVLGLYEWGALADDAGVPADGSGFRGVALALNCASEADVDTVFAAWVAAGATVTKAPHKAFWGGYSSYVADPDGHLWEIAYNPYSRLDEQGILRID